MIERIARIICESQGGNPDAIIQGEGAATGRTWAGWQAYASEARAIVTSMREPTDGMLQAEGVTVSGKTLRVDSYLEDHSALSVWQAMIDAALAEDPACPTA